MNIFQHINSDSGAVDGSISSRDRREKIDTLETAIRAQPDDLRAQFAPEIVHHFAPGLYAREMRLPKGAVVTSKVHKYPGLSILSKGSMALYMDDGTVQTISAGFHIVAPAGARRVGVALEDAVWTCMHPTNETDLEKIEAHFIAQTTKEYLAFTREQHQIAATAEGEKPCLGLQ